MKNALILIALALLGLVIAAFGYVWFFAAAPAPVEDTLSDQSPFMDIGDRPFGEIPTNQNTSTTSQPVRALVLTKLWRVTTQPVAASVIWSEQDTEEPNYFVRYLERGTGHIYEQNVFTRKVVKLTNTTVPRIQYARWLSDENHLALQYLSANLQSTETYVATIAQKDPDANLRTEELRENAFTLDGVFLERFITSLAGSPTGNSLVYNVPTEEGSALKVRRQDGSLTTIQNSPHSRLQVAWPESNTITLTTNAAEGIPGFHYFLNPSGTNERVHLYHDDALTALTNPNLTRTVFYTVRDSLPMLILQTEGSLDTKTLPLTTLPEKCVWSPTQDAMLYCAVPSELPRADFPDSWYQGRLAFFDTLWAIDTDSLTTKLFASHVDFQNFGAADGMDAYRFTIDPSGRYLSFINRKDFSLWAMEIPAQETSANLPESL